MIAKSMHEPAFALRRVKSLLEGMPAGAERDELLGNFIRFRDKFEALPSRVASFAPCKTAEEARVVMHREIRAAFAELDRNN